MYVDCLVHLLQFVNLQNHPLEDAQFVQLLYHSDEYRLPEDEVLPSFYSKPPMYSKVEAVPAVDVTVALQLETEDNLIDSWRQMAPVHTTVVVAAVTRQYNRPLALNSDSSPQLGHSDSAN